MFSVRGRVRLRETHAGGLITDVPLKTRAGLVDHLLSNGHAHLCLRDPISCCLKETKRKTTFFFWGGGPQKAHPTVDAVPGYGSLPSCMGDYTRQRRELENFC